LFVPRLHHSLITPLAGRTPTLRLTRSDICGR
jgi:hypothetical protein